MKALPLKARLFIVVTTLTGAFFLVFSQSQALAGTRPPNWEVLIFLALSVVAGGTKINLSSRLKNAEAGSMSLGFAVALAALLKCGLAAGVIVNAGGTLWSCLYPKRQATPQLIFNVALACIEGTLGGLVYASLKPATLSGHTVQAFLAVTATSLTYYAVNTFSVSVVIALCTQKNPLKVWK